MKKIEEIYESIFNEAKMVDKYEDKIREILSNVWSREDSADEGYDSIENILLVIIDDLMQWSEALNQGLNDAISMIENPEEDRRINKAIDSLNKISKDYNKFTKTL